MQPELQIHTVPLSKIKPLPRNRRKHGERNLAEIKASLLDHAQVEPLIVQRSTGRIIAGNGRYAVMAKLGVKTAAVVYLDVDDAKASQLAIRLNRTAELAGWEDGLRDEIARLADEGIDLDSLGFNPDEVWPEPPDESKAQLVERKLQEPPAMTWILIGVPTIRFGEFADRVKEIAETPGILCETSVSSARPEAKDQDQD